MAEQAAGPARQHGSEPVAAIRQPAMPDGVDTAVHPMQTARAQPMLDSGRCPAHLYELPMRNDAVLAGCDLGHQPIT
jgi:hypothetical protein